MLYLGLNSFSEKELWKMDVQKDAKRKGPIEHRVAVGSAAVLAGALVLVICAAFEKKQEPPKAATVAPLPPAVELVALRNKLGQTWGEVVRDLTEAELDKNIRIVNALDEERVQALS